MEKFDIFMIDPAWLKTKGGIRRSRPNQGKELDYPTMTTENIFKLLDREIFSMAKDVHAVFMWTIEQYLIECEKYIEERGYKRHCRFIWNKMNGVAPAFTIRYSHEYLIWFYKPKMIPIAKEQQGKFMTVFEEKAREHSRKPNFAYEMIEKLYPNTSKIDVFSREKRDGWEQYGNEINYFKTCSAK